MSGWVARGTGAVVAVGVVLVSWPFTPAMSAQIAARGHTRAGRASAAVEWAGFGGNAQHTAGARKPIQPLSRIRWKAKVDHTPVKPHQVLLIHYGSPMITAANTVLVPTLISAKAGFRVVAYSGASGARRWSLSTDYQ